MSDVIQVHDQFYILATAAIDPDRTRVLKSGDAFVSFDRFGDVRTLGQTADGLFTTARATCRGSSCTWRACGRCC